MTLILPSHPDFHQILQSTLPFGSPSGSNFVVRADTGLIESVDSRQLLEYVYGGEYDKLLEITGDDELEEEFEDSDEYDQ